MNVVGEGNIRADILATMAKYVLYHSFVVPTNRFHATSDYYPQKDKKACKESIKR
jgi:hypothetical protein